MPTSLPKDLHNQLARITLAARDRAESAARAALENLAVHEKDYRPHTTVKQRLLRNRLRARGRALGDTLNPHKGTQEIDHLAADTAYEHWHRLLFTRFLTENHLLITDAVYGSVPVTLQDCEELAPELGARDGFELACRFAGQILPGVFRQNDPVLELTLALNDQVELRRLLEALPAAVFRADDALGWTYQFWQTRRKGEVNASERTPTEKAASLRGKPIVTVSQKGQLGNPDARVIIGREFHTVALLGEFCECYQGIVTGDQSRFCRGFWELANYDGEWVSLRASCKTDTAYSGVEQVLLWENSHGQLHEYARMTREQLHDMHESGNRAWGRLGVAVNRMRNLRTTLYYGEHFENNLAVIVPQDSSILPAVWAFCSEDTFKKNVRALDQKVNLTNATLVKIPFDLPHWQKVAAEKYPNGLPKPHSDDPTQWLFNGHPKGSEQPLHVAVARLLGYRWPRQTGSSFPDCPALDPDALEEYADADGIVCLPPIHREQPAAARLRALLATALGSFDERALIAATGSKKNHPGGMAAR